MFISCVGCGDRLGLLLKFNGKDLEYLGFSIYGDDMSIPVAYCSKCLKDRREDFVEAGWDSKLIEAVDGWFELDTKEKGSNEED